MNASAQPLFDAALNLPSDDRVELVEALIASLQETDVPPFDWPTKEELAKRTQEIRFGEVKPISWEDVKQKAREKAGG